MNCFALNRILIQPLLLLVVVFWAIPAVAGPDCKQLEGGCVAECERILQESRKVACKDGKSGCHDDVIGCGSRACMWAYTQKWCDIPGYVGCVGGVVSTYQQCTEECNTKLQESKSYGERVSTASECPKSCYAPFEQGTQDCRNQACQVMCQANGASGGHWVRYSLISKSWDDCECSGGGEKGKLAPVARAGSDVTVNEGETVRLSAEGSYDPDGRIVFYYWYWNETKIAVGNMTQPRNFPAGENIVTLEVVDNDGLIGRDTVVVTVVETPQAKEDCNKVCKQILGDDAIGKGTPPNCKCSCSPGFRESPETGFCEEYSCQAHCLDVHGDHATGRGVYPKCECSCEARYIPDNKTKKCKSDCPRFCKETYGEHSIVTAEEPYCQCECDTARGYRWNDNQTVCVTNCDMDGKCDFHEGEKCHNCPDCECKTPPWTQCNSDPARPMREIPYENKEGCYAPDVGEVMAKDCEEAAAEYRSCNDAFLAFLQWQSKRTTAPIQVDWDPRSPTSGLRSNLGKWLVKLGYFDEKGVPNPGASVWGEGPFRTFQMRMQSLQARCQALCAGTSRKGALGLGVFAQDPCSAPREARTNFTNTEEYHRRVKQVVLREPGSIADVQPGSSIYSNGGVKQVTLPNGQAVFESEFEITALDDKSVIINLINGQATYLSFADERVEFKGPASLKIDARGTPSSFVSPLDSASLQRWWESAETRRLEKISRSETVREKAPPATGCKAVAGEWKWFIGGSVVLKDSGTAIGYERGGQESNRGTWRCVNENPVTIEIRWVRGGWLDTLTLTSNGQRLEGKNQQGILVWGERKLD